VGEVVKIATDWRRATLDAQEFAILEFAEKLTLTPSLIGQDDVKRLHEAGLTDQQIFASIQAISYRNFISRVADSLGVELEDERNVAPEILEASGGKHEYPVGKRKSSTERVADRLSSLSSFPGDDLSTVLARIPEVGAADERMWREIRSHVPDRWYALVSVCITDLLGLDGRLEELRGVLAPELARAVAADWSTASLSDTERAILAFTQKATVTQAQMHPSDVGALRAAGLDDRQILAVASLVAYQNYALRAAQAFGVRTR